jgi:MFS family permease
VGFAALTMNRDLGLSQTAFGFGAGIFFIAYFIFEVPSNLLLERFGARKWIARIMLSWGIISGMMAFTPHHRPRHRARQRVQLLSYPRAAWRGRAGFFQAGWYFSI